MKPRTYAADAMFSEVAKTFPLIHRYTEELGRESVQISVWLVGLAAALMGFIATMPKALSLMPRWQSIAVTSALALVVLLGLAHRVLYQAAENRTRNHLLGLHAFLSSDSIDFVTPIELDEHWTTAEIASRLREDFGRDFPFPKNEESSLDPARKYYRIEYDFWQARDLRRRKLLGSTLGAYSEPTNTPRTIEAAFTTSGPRDLSAIQRETDSLSKLLGVVRLITYACYGTFALGIIVFLWAIILVLPTKMR